MKVSQITIPELTDAQRQANREIDAHLRAAERALSRDDDKKAGGHLIAATQISEAHGIPHFGRYNLTGVRARQGARKHYARERALKNREVPA